MKLEPGRVERRIVDFRQDEERAWIAELECGHSVHVRHDPPWQVRPWVLTAEGRAGRLGTALTCRQCAESGTEAAAYEDALLQGLCPDGAREAARAEVRRLDGAADRSQGDTQRRTE